MVNKLKQLVKEEQGQGMTEYGMLLGLIAVACVAALIAFRTEITALFTELSTTVRNIVP
ncbi:Flp family type IVb pilin [Paenibacillus sp.]|uniref:Flp family type IVb pilin n=1 Tax=Paenibacillus sp. TaxID=58172 RepID=UPI002D4489DF|nr:Flp family type IVb pilin [Paenibacillus sp.]HZG84290.1 Flp family type IVb pilin [Paenibacillus sp.]